MQSMTGYGRGVATTEQCAVEIEIRTINQRFLEFNIRLPHRYLVWEEQIRKQIKEHISRGKVDVYVTIREGEQENPQVIVHKGLLQAYKEGLEEAQSVGFEQEPIRLQDVMQLSTEWVTIAPRVWSQEEEQLFSSILSDALQEAIQGVLDMRLREGAHLKEDLQKRCERLVQVIDDITARKEHIIKSYKLRLMEKIAAIFANKEYAMDENRILQEVAIHADKVDFTEEVVRFRSHVVQLTKLMTLQKPIGRQVDFLLQEMNREVNTLGSKTTDIDVTAWVMLLKNEIEKIREQIQNIE